MLEKYKNVIVVTDEVYEHICFSKMTRIATLKGLFDRTIAVSSSGKTFACTGWKVGWAVAPEALIEPLKVIQMNAQFCVSTPAQKAVSECLEIAERPFEGFPTFYAFLEDSYRRKRDILFEVLKKAGLKPSLPGGSFFMTADVSHVRIPEKYLHEKLETKPEMTRDWAFSRFLTQEIGVTSIPYSAFYLKDKSPA